MNREQVLEETLRNILEGVNAPDIDPMGDTEFGLHCGVEDIGATDRYGGANYGYSQGVEAALEWAANEAQEALKRAYGI